MNFFKWVDLLGICPFHFHLVLYYMAIAPLQYFACHTPFKAGSVQRSIYKNISNESFSGCIIESHHIYFSCVFFSAFFHLFKNRLLSRRTRFLSCHFIQQSCATCFVRALIWFFFSIILVSIFDFSTKTNGFLWASQSVLRISFVYWWLISSFVWMLFDMAMD